jgi:nucleotide-binding universal stress UspA family protein
VRLDPIVVGVDGSEAGREALRQAVRLLAREGRVVAVSAYDTGATGRAGWDAASLAAQLRREAEAARAEAARELAGLPRSEARLAAGDAVAALLSAAEDERAALLAVGAHGAGRMAGIVLGSVATALAHRAPCPVLLARASDEDPFARGIVVGVDGSAQSAEAERVALELAKRLAVPLRAVVATGGKPVATERLRSVWGLEWDDRNPVDALVGRSRQAGLVVVGSRGLHGLGALGSVSERVAHEAECSVLVVRPAAWTADAAERAASASAG